MFSGIAVSQGYSMGRALIVEQSPLDYSAKVFSSAENEKARLSQAVCAFTNLTAVQAENIRKIAGKGVSEILKGHICMLEDPYMLAQMFNEIEQKRVTAEEALDCVCTSFVNLFSNAKDDFTRQRALDIKDIRNNLLAALLNTECVNFSEVKDNTILVSKDFLPSMAGLITGNNIVGVIAETGGVSAHSAILARAMEIPAVFSLDKATKTISDGDLLLLDGVSGKVTVFPNRRQKAEFDRQKAQFNIEKKNLYAFLNKSTFTKSGKQKKIYCNISHANETSDAIKYSGEGIGLFRTEFLFINRENQPSEEEQFTEYSTAAKELGGKPLVIRTLDIGGDKAIPSLEIIKEDNPFLGRRAIRYCLDNTELFKKQLKAILRAGVFGDVKMLLPLITNVDEVRQTKRLIEECKNELKAQKEQFSDVPLGIMIETPAAAIISDVLAKEVSFFSIGTNDLIGYTMAVDRTNGNLSKLYDVFQQPVLRLIKYVIDNAKKMDIELSISGESASDAELIPRLLEWGVTTFSVSPPDVLKTRKIISECE